MSVTLKIDEGTQALPSAGGNVAALFGVSSEGDENGIYEISGGQGNQIPDSLGYGRLVEEGARVSDVAGADCILVKVPAAIDPVIGSVDHNDAEGNNGTGPTLTLDGDPTDDFVLRILVTEAGDVGEAKVRIALDGDTYGGDVDVPDELPAMLRGTVDLTGLTLSTLNTKTFIANPDGAGSQTTTFTTPTSVDDIAAQINATVGTLVARIIAGRYLQVEGVTKGSAGSLDVGSGTANADLGFAANPDSVTGTDSEYEIPKTGITISFPSGADYLEGETYTAICTGPRMAIEDVQTAMEALRESGVTFSMIKICQDPVDADDALEWATALDTLCAGIHNATEDRLFPVWVMGTCLGSTDPERTTRNDDFAANDASVRTAFSTHESLYGIMAHGDMYVSGFHYLGSFRRSVCVPLLERFAAARLSADPGNGAFSALPGCSMVGPDGVTQARDENFATVKMASRGFCTAIKRAGKARIKAGATRANPLSKLAFPGVMRMAYLAAFVLYQRERTYENADLSLAADGTLRELVAAAIEKVFDKDLEEQLVKEGHASGRKAVVDRSQVADEQGKYPLKVTAKVQMNGQVRDVAVTLSLVSALQVA